jgi:protein TonB
MAATTPPSTPIEVSARWLPTAIKLVEPHYPQAAQVRGLEGWVDLMLKVAPTGEVIDAQVRDREGSRSFERAALLAVRQWRYEPNAAGSSAPALEIPVRVAFKLE